MILEAAVAAASIELDVHARLVLLVDALALWRGPPLDEFAGLAWADDLAGLWTWMYVLAEQLRVHVPLDDGNHRDAQACSNSSCPAIRCTSRSGSC